MQVVKSNCKNMSQLDFYGSTNMYYLAIQNISNGQM